jgi:hypothetical protein
MKKKNIKLNDRVIFRIYHKIKVTMPLKFFIEIILGEMLDKKIFLEILGKNRAFWERIHG